MTVPHFTSTFDFSGVRYTAMTVGTDPKLAPVSTTIDVEIIPVKLVFADGVVLDNTALVGSLVKSPLFVTGTYQEGSTQFGDAVMRSEFWSYASGTPYHVLLGNPVVEPTTTVDVPAADGYTSGSGSSATGFATFAWFIQTIEPQLLRQFDIRPTTLAMFVTRRLHVLEPGGHCCFSGYHATLPLSTPSGQATFTTAWSSLDNNAIVGMSHEVAEWMNDPFNDNIVPAWVFPGKTSCGGHKLEVGDPVTNFTFTVNGYAVQDIVFYSWFTRTSPSIGIGGAYDLLHKLAGPAMVCP